MIKTQQLISESAAVPGALEGWLDPKGVCHYVIDTHPEWVARYIGELPPDITNVTGYAVQGMRLRKLLYDKGWVKIVFTHDTNVLYFDTFNTHWKQLSRAQRHWVYDAAIHGVEIKGDKIEINAKEFRNPPYRIRFGNTSEDDFDPRNITEKTSMISFSKIMRRVLMERMSFRNLLQGSESGRKDRAKHVNTRPSRVISTDDGEAWLFNYKSDGLHSTTGNRWHGFVRFFKEDVSGKDNALDLDCMVDCDCYDYRYRYAYNNKQADVGFTGKHDDWKYDNQNNGQPWKPRSQGGVGDFGVGACKHLCALLEYLKTQIEPNAPDPDDEVEPVIKPKPKVKPPVSMQKQTINAPKPEDAPRPEDNSYSDSRTGSDTLQEQQHSGLYERIDNFVRTHPQFEIQFEVEDESNQNLTEDYHHFHKDYRLYEGSTYIVAVFEDNSRLQFNVHFRNNYKDDRWKHRSKAASKWKTLATKIHNEEELTEQGNPIEKSWKECFREALKDPKMKEYVRAEHEQPIF